MRKITEEEVDFILNDLATKGVTIEDLQYNLLDHICCIIENEMSENETFHSFYQKIMPRFFKKELKEIQVETENLLTFKNYYAMKKTLKITGITSIVFTLIGSVLKTFHLPGAALTIVLGALIFSLIFLPLLIVIKFKDEEKRIDKWVLSFGLFLAMTMATGTLFKLMHWPGANIMMLFGLVVFTFIYVPIYFFTRVKRAELKFNTIVNSVLMMACGGLFFALFNLNPKINSMKKEKTFNRLRNSSEELLNATVNKENRNLIIQIEKDIDILETQFQ